MEDWDSEYLNTNNPAITDYTVNKSFTTKNIAEVETIPERGRTFGSRGRGFKKLDNEAAVGRKYGSANDHNFIIKNTNDFDVWESNENDKRSKDATKPKSTYIPEAPSDDVNEIFGNGISSGINFKNYDDIKVNVSGDNFPPPIQSFNQSGLLPELLHVIAKCNYMTPTPIQKYSIPIIMDGRDMMACAQTGSGKTAAFLIPIINNILEVKGDFDCSDFVTKPQVLILSPTRELSIQIFNEARKFSYGTSIQVVIVYGGTSVYHQIENIKKGCHILVGTPGRLLDFVQRKILDFSKIRYLVLDEADRMLNMGFLPEMKRIILHPTMVDSSDRQTLMFSATFPDEVQHLATMFLRDYLFVAVGIVGGACSDVEQKFFSVSKFDKRNKLIELLRQKKSSKVLVFVELKRMADFIATFLSEKNFPATSIHGDREQREREMALRDFKTGRMDILVATSVAARGLDIKNVSHVINFDLPNSIDEYVHRIGRTGRVGNRGLATSFFDPSRDAHLAPSLLKILSQARQEIPDFLRDVEYGDIAQDISTDFGGNDYRQNIMDNSAKAADTFEDEQW